MVVRTDLHASVLKSEYNTKVGRWGSNLIQAARTRAILDSPKSKRGGWKTENLWAQHRATTKFRLGGNAYRIGLLLENQASYAWFVHEGTTGPIFPLYHDYLVFPGAEINSPRFRVRLEYVNGQPANPWLREALQAQLRAAGVPKQIRRIGRG